MAIVKVCILPNWNSVVREKKLVIVAIILQRIKDNIFFSLNFLSSLFWINHSCTHADIVGPLSSYLDHALHIIWPAGGSKGQDINAGSELACQQDSSVLLCSSDKSHTTQAHTNTHIYISFSSKNKKLILKNHHIRHLLYQQKSQSLMFLKQKMHI